jgi:uncharacterized membrane protein YobD (UPF0266 family)
MRNFKRNRTQVLLTLYCSIASGIVGVLYLRSGHSVITTIWFLSALGWGIRYIWSVRSPIIRMTKDELIMNMKMADSLKTIKLDQIARVDQSDSKLLRIITKDGEQTKIKVNSIQYEQRQTFIDNLVISSNATT